jgi:sarcosine oxidase subunit delta
MASLITCPHCGTRPKEEFAIRGDAEPRRPSAGDKDEAWLGYVYTRDNRKGRIREYWHHAGGCRRWLVVERDNLSHEVYGVTDVSQFLKAEAGE